MRASTSMRREKRGVKKMKTKGKLLSFPTNVQNIVNVSPTTVVKTFIDLFNMFLLRRVTRFFVRFFTISISQGLAWIRDGEARSTATTANETKNGGNYKNHRSQKKTGSTMDGQRAEREQTERKREWCVRERERARERQTVASFSRSRKTTQAQTNFAECEREERV